MIFCCCLICVFVFIVFGVNFTEVLYPSNQLGVKPELASVLLILLFVMFFFLNMSKLISLKEA